MATQFNITNSSRIPSISGSDFGKGIVYHLKQFHFHWGLNVYQGSEHHINGIKYPGEVCFLPNETIIFLI